MTVPCGFNSGIRFGISPIGCRGSGLPSNNAGDDGLSVQVSLARAEGQRPLNGCKCTFMRPRNILTENGHFIVVNLLCRLHEDSTPAAGLIISRDK